MRRLVNNFLFGQTSELLLGRLDTDIYGNSCSVLKNMKVHRQGGISRRPPLKKKILAEGYTRAIRFEIDSANVYAVLFGPSKIGIYDYNTNEIYSDGLSLPSHTVASHSWANITEAQIRDVKFAQYYNDIYFVHPSFPLMRIRYNSSFIISLPQVKVNQDVAQYEVVCNITKDSAVAGSGSFLFCGEKFDFTTTVSTSVNDLMTMIKGHEWDGFKVETRTENNYTYLVFTADTLMGRYQMYAFDDTDSFGIQGEIGFSCAWELNELDRDSLGLVYASDDFHDCWLNRQEVLGNGNLGNWHFACNIKIIGEKMFLFENGDPCNIYFSRPYATSQIIYPPRSNDTILDFIQFELVATTKTQVKEDENMPISIMKDTDDEYVWEGTRTNQKLWLPPETGTIHSKQDLDRYRNGYSVNGNWNSANEYLVEYVQNDATKVNKIKKNTTTKDTYVDYIQLSSGYFVTKDTKVDMSKMEWDYDHDYYKSKEDTYFYRYEYEEGGQTHISYIQIVAADEGGTDHGIINKYKKTSDATPDPAKRYYTNDGTGYTLVENPVTANMGSYFELYLEFSETVSVYEFGDVYVFSGTAEQLDVTYLYNGMIGYMTYQEDVKVMAIPHYVIDMAIDSDIIEETTEIDRVATSSTSAEFQLASGKNDRLTWIELGDWIMVGTESDEYRLALETNALSIKPQCYSSWGSPTGLCTKLGADIIFLQKGNGLRMLYKDNWGLQNMELTLTNPDIMQGTIRELMSMVVPEPAVFALKSDGTIINLCIDRANGVQAFSEWTFEDTPISLCDLRDHLLALVKTEDNHTYIAEFDSGETSKFSDCGFTYIKTNDTTIVSGKTYYTKSGTTYTPTTPTSNPKSEGLYEYSLENHVYQYNSIMTANPFDSIMQDGSVTIGEAKNVTKMIFRCVRTGHVRTWFNEKDKTLTRTPVCCDKTGTYDGLPADHLVNVNGGTTRDLMISVEAVGDEPMTLLAMAYDVRINKNG